MRYQKLGADGPEISVIGLGCMSLGGTFGPTDQETSFACLQAAVEADVTFWDTANIYGAGLSEDTIGAFLAQSTARPVLATKVGIDRVGDEMRFNNAPDHIRSELETSLTRLGRDYVPLYYLHRREAARPVEEVIETMVALIEEGLIGGYGLSEVAPSTIKRAHAVHPCMAVQNEYSLWSRLPELGVVQTCAELGITFVPFSPLARGFLTDRSVGPEDFGKGDFRAGMPRFLEPNFGFNCAHRDAFRSFARSRGWTTAAAALAWILDQGDNIVPIPATRTEAHLSQWLGAPDIRFSDEDRAQIGQILPIGWAHGDRYDDGAAQNVERYC